MASFRQDVNHPDRSSGLLNSSIAQGTTRPPVSKFSNLHASLQPTSLKKVSLDNMASKAAEDRISHAHFSSVGGHDGWPVSRSKRSLAEIKTAIAGDPQRCSPSTNVSSPTKQTLPGISSAPKKDAATLKKRKGSVPDLGLGPMTTVQEGCLDSPTIPGHHPLFLRSMSVPDYKLRPLSEETNENTPQGSGFTCANKENSAVVEVAAKTSSSNNMVRRRSSMILQKDLAPLVIPSSTQPEQTGQAWRDKASDEKGDRPPRVPPKSPRTKSRASPRPRKLPHSATSSISTVYSNASAATSTSSLVGRTSPKPKLTSPRVESLSAQNGSLNNIKEHVSAEYPPNHNHKNSSPHVESPRNQHCGQNSKERDILTVNTTGRNVGEMSCHEKRIEPAEEKNTIEHGLGMCNEREISNASVIDRARTMRREDTLLDSLSKPKVPSPIYKGEDAEIPTGLNAREASHNVPQADLKILRQQAKERVENFKVLSLKDESDLSKELVLLDDRCQYLRSIYTSLRQSRKGLHARMVSCLKSPRMAKFSCESVLKQEEALAELDLSIDDWVSKLEHAETRRSLIRQKLLEHLAAMLTIKTAEKAQLQRDNEVQTPPTSPEKTDDKDKSKRGDVQSIQVYADSGVAALLSAIETEIVFMGGLASSS